MGADGQVLKCSSALPKYRRQYSGVRSILFRNEYGRRPYVYRLWGCANVVDRSLTSFCPLRGQNLSRRFSHLQFHFVISHYVIGH